MAIITVLVIAGALAFGLLMHRYLRWRSSDDDDGRADAEGLGIGELAVPLLTLVTLLLAFVLVATFSSYREASDRAGAEAGAVLEEAEAAQVLPNPAGQRILGSLQCYARAVAGPGWRSLSSTRQTDPISIAADTQVRAVLVEAQESTRDSAALSAVVDADRDRVIARRGRLAEAHASVPSVVTVLLIGIVAVTVAAIAALADRRIRHGLRLILVGVSTLMLTATLLVLFDLDQPFGGWIAIAPTDMVEVEKAIGAQLLDGQPPCDASGAPTPQG
jgi:hypothetical protein